MANQNLRDRYSADGAGVTPLPRLLVMLFDRLVADVRNSIAALGRGELEVVNKKLCNAQAILLELHAALDLDAWPQGESLSRLYLWLANELMAANTEKNASKMQACLRMLDQLNDAWKQAYDTSQAAIHAAAAASVAPAVPTAVDGAGAVVPVGTGS